jgi:integrase
LEAQQEAQRIATQLTKGDLDGAGFTRGQSAACARALQMLEPTGVPIEVAVSEFVAARKALGNVSLSRAVEYYLRRHALNNAPSISKIVDELLKSKKQDGLKDNYLRHLRYDLDRFCEAFPEMNINDIHGPDIENWLRLLEVSPRTRKNYRTQVQTLFSYAKARKYIAKDNDEIDAVLVPKVKGGNIEIFSADELTTLLNHADSHVIPFLALGAFAGIRHAEIERLDWRDIRLEDHLIEIKASKSKTASRRMVPLLPNLKSWLLPHMKVSGPICTYKNMAEEIAQLVKTINTRYEEQKNESRFRWKKNGLRHSFISYRVAQVQNVAQVALEAGNSPQVIFSCYRELVRPTDAERWFNILPGTPENLVPLEKTVAA